MLSSQKGVGTCIQDTLNHRSVNSSLSALIQENKNLPIAAVIVSGSVFLFVFFIMEKELINFNTSKTMRSDPFFAGW